VDGGIGAMTGKWEFLPEFIVRSTGIEYELLGRLSFDRTYALLQAGTEDERPFHEELEEKRRLLYETFLRPDVREALYLQNRGFYGRNIVAGEIPNRNSRMRQREITLISYLQRFCAKNENHSYFGPVFWGRNDQGQQANLRIVQKPGRWIRPRVAFMETWAVAALAEAMNRDEGLKEDLPIRLNPELRMDHGRLFRNDIDLSPGLTGDELKWVALSERGTTRRALRRTGEDPGVAWDGLFTNGILSSGLYICHGRRNALEDLSDWVRGLPADCPRKDHWEQVLGRFRRYGDLWSEKPLGEKIRLEEELMGYFKSVTGEEGEREGSGRILMGRRLFFDLAERNVDMRIGGELGRDVEKWMSVHWKMYLLHTVARARDVAAFLKDQYPPGRRAVWWNEIVEVLESFRKKYPGPSPSGERIHIDISKHMEKLFSGKMDAHRVRCRLSDFDFLDGLLEREGIGKVSVASFWDLFVAAGDAEDIAKGEYRWVLGEYDYDSQAIPVYFRLIYAWGKEALGDLEEKARRFYGEVDGHVMDNRYFYDGQSFCRYVSFLDFIDLVGTANRCSVPMSCPSGVPSGRARVIFEDDRIGIELTPGGKRYDSMDIASGYHARKSIAHAGYPHAYLSGLSPKHCPRIEIEKAVLERERWLLDRKDLGRYDFGGNGLRLFREFLRFQRDYGFPRHVFIQSYGERKPMMLDFKNFFLIEAAARMLLKASEARVVEMLPDPDQFWFRDDRGRYPCEFRWMGGLVEPGKRP